MDRAEVEGSLLNRPAGGTGGMPAPARDATAYSAAARSASTVDWVLETCEGGAGSLHGRPWPDPPRPTVRLLQVDRPALVLGSTQPDDAVDTESAERRGVEVVRRRSGGGAVMLVPGEVLWIDVFVPARHQLWEADVGLAFAWLGQMWVDALAELTITGHWHRRSMPTSPWSHLVCFAGVGAGEVTVGGRKVVGMSQRRTRAGSMFQCAALLRWDPTALLELLRMKPATRREAVEDLTRRAAGLAVSPEVLASAAVRQLRSWPKQPGVDP